MWVDLGVLKLTPGWQSGKKQKIGYVLLWMIAQLVEGLTSSKGYFGGQLIKDVKYKLV